jgi:GNAT superfamily N-acetyltransferase
MMCAMRDVRTATVQDLPGAYRVCLLTGDAGRDATAVFENPDLLGHVYVGPYIVGEPSLALVVADEEGIAGYCLAALDTTRFSDWAETAWWPSLRRQYPLRALGSGSGQDAGIIALIHRPPMAPAQIVDAYPSHLHIDLLERARGSGMGRTLIERQLEQLRAAGSVACHLTAGVDNANAIAFYEHLGWSILYQEAGECVMGIRLS